MFNFLYLLLQIPSSIAWNTSLWVWFMIWCEDRICVYQLLLMLMLWPQAVTLHNLHTYSDVNIGIFKFEYWDIQIWISGYSNLNIGIFKFEYWDIQTWIWKWRCLKSSYSGMEMMMKTTVRSAPCGSDKHTLSGTPHLPSLLPSFLPSCLSAEACLHWNTECVLGASSVSRQSQIRVGMGTDWGEGGSWVSFFPNKGQRFGECGLAGKFVYPSQY